MQNENSLTGPVNFRPNTLAYSLVIVSLIILLAAQIVYIFITFGRNTLSQIKEYTTILQILSYSDTALMMAAGVLLLAGFGGRDISRRGLYITGSVLLIVSFLPVLLQNIFTITVTFGGHPPTSEYFTTLLISVLLIIITYKFSIFSVGLSVFRGYRMAFVITGFILGVIGLGIAYFIDYEQFTSILSGSPSPFSPGLSSSYYVQLVESVHILDILSIVFFIAAFAVSLSQKKTFRISEFGE